jgi:hypothetical protein
MPIDIFYMCFDDEKDVGLKKDKTDNYIRDLTAGGMSWRRMESKRPQSVPSNFLSKIITFAFL